MTMTREEVIRWLICVKEEVDESEGTMIYISKKQADALGMAIEALHTDVVHCKDCIHANECHKSVQYTRHELNAVTIGYSPIEWCSRGEHKGGDDE